MREICAHCGTVHVGFTSRPNQVRAFWRCRHCSMPMVTMVQQPGKSSEDFHVVPLSAHNSYNAILHKRWEAASELLHDFLPYCAELQTVVRLAEESTDSRDFYQKMTKYSDERQVLYLQERARAAAREAEGIVRPALSDSWTPQTASTAALRT